MNKKSISTEEKDTSATEGEEDGNGNKKPATKYVLDKELQDDRNEPKELRKLKKKLRIIERVI